MLWADGRSKSYENATPLSQLFWKREYALDGIVDIRLPIHHCMPQTSIFGEIILAVLVEVGLACYDTRKSLRHMHTFIPQKHKDFTTRTNQPRA
eukprot:scaffold4860_cov115-Skeletonema_marinoi.AAC.1